jgi:hypothetical protein
MEVAISAESHGSCGWMEEGEIDVRSLGSSVVVKALCYKPEGCGFDTQ